MRLAKLAPLALVLGLAACGTTTTERASIGGAVAGGLIGGDLAGAAVGGVAGAAIGAATTDRRDRDYCRDHPCVK